MSPALLNDQEQASIHQPPLPEILERLNSSFSGLAEQEVLERLRHFEFNKLTEQKELSLLVKFLLQFNNFFSYLLLLGAALSFVSEMLQPGEGSIFIAEALLAVAILNASFTFIQQHKAEKAMKSFKNLMTSKVIVLRQGKRRQIDSTNIVPGDVMLLSEGDRITADARLFEIAGLKVNHSALTGESEPLLRSTEPTSSKLLMSRNMVLSGTLVQSGSGKAVVVATGDNTQIGRIAGATREIGIEASHMQKEIGYFIKIISYIAIFLGVSFFLLGWVVVKNPFWTNIIFAISIIVANVPEGLLPTVTLTLSLAAQRMAREKVLVKNIDSIETLGSVTIICSDKTGTLTENDLFVHGFFLNGRFYSYNREERQIISDFETINLKRIAGVDDFNQILVLCNNSSFDSRSGDSFGDSTEICLKQFVSAFDSVEYIEKQHTRIQDALHFRNPVHDNGKQDKRP
ncbi:MAG: Calcium-transporting ATPase 1 [Syntrophus sp. PtaU1.Bin208]|nr:MAG: Calcium-transporting ATPase 1 [Syntrophus sp. PtaU1.Bin208]